jgi:hypothetical protein
MELSRKVCVAEGMERSMSLLCAAIRGMRGKSVCRGGLSDKMPPSRRAIQGNSCKSVCRAAKCAVPAPVLPAIHGMVSKSVCRDRGCVVHVPDSLRDTEICSGKCVSQVVWLDFRGAMGRRRT